MKIERGRNRRGTSFGSRNFSGGLMISHPYERTTNPSCNGLLPDDFSLIRSWLFKLVK